MSKTIRTKPPRKINFKGVAYVAGPYRGKTIRDVVENIREAEAAAVELWKRGYAVICPHKNTALLDGIATDEVFLQGDLEILKRCDLLVLLPRWQESAGAVAEHDYAREHGINRRDLYDVLREPKRN